MSEDDIKIPTPANGGGLNETVEDVIILLEREIERLKVSLDNFRMSEHPNRQELIRWHVRALDERQDTLESLKRTVLEQGSCRKTVFTLTDHWLPGGAGGKLIPSKSKSDLMRCFIAVASLTKVSRNCVRWRSSR